MDYRIFNMRTWLCMRIHTGVGYTDRVSTTFFTWKNSHKFSCAPDAHRARTSGLWISSKTLYQLSLISASAVPSTRENGGVYWDILKGLYRWKDQERNRQKEKEAQQKLLLLKQAMFAEVLFFPGDPMGRCWRYEHTFNVCNRKLDDILNAHANIQRGASDGCRRNVQVSAKMSKKTFWPNFLSSIYDLSWTLIAPSCILIAANLQSL